MSGCIGLYTPVGHTLVHKVDIFHNEAEEGHDPASLLRLVCLADRCLKSLTILCKVVDRIHKSLRGSMATTLKRK